MSTGLRIERLNYQRNCAPNGYLSVRSWGCIFDVLRVMEVRGNGDAWLRVQAGIDHDYLSLCNRLPDNIRHPHQLHRRLGRRAILSRERDLAHQGQLVTELQYRSVFILDAHTDIDPLEETVN